MAVVVVGGHSRNVGKTSVVAGLIAAMPELNWTALKITQYGHGICSADGKACDCATDDHSWAVTEERSRAGDSDSSRFLQAGARQVFWVRTRQGRLAEAMPRVRNVLAGADNAIIESNSIVGFLRPDLYLTVLDPAIADFKDSARLFLDRADAILVHAAGEPMEWEAVSAKLYAGKPLLCIQPTQYVNEEVIRFVRGRITAPSLPRQ